MKIAAVICEYNPLHLGHIRQFRAIRDALGEDTRIICLMSGSYVQRGAPAVFSAPERAQAAVLCGADLVLELPLTASLSSAEGFAAGAVEILDRLGTVDELCFGCESGDGNLIMSTASLLRSDRFQEALRERLTLGDSFAATRQKALEAVGGDGSVLERPNDILAVEYCKALLARNSSMQPLAIRREGGYHDAVPDPENPSAAALRALMPDPAWLDYVPAPARSIFAEAAPHRMEWGERAILARLRAMDGDEFEALPYGAEGLWRKLMAGCRKAATLEELIASVKSRRYVRTRIERMILCAFLGVREADFSAPVESVRVLAFNSAGRKLVRQAREYGQIALVNAGQRLDSPYAALEDRANRLYPLFLSPDAAPAIPEKQRVFVLEDAKIDKIT